MRNVFDLTSFRDTRPGRAVAETAESWTADRPTPESGSTSFKMLSYRSTPDCSRTAQGCRRGYGAPVMLMALAVRDFSPRLPSAHERWNRAGYWTGVVDGDSGRARRVRSGAAAALAAAFCVITGLVLAGSPMLIAIDSAAMQGVNSVIARQQGLLTLATAGRGQSGRRGRRGGGGGGGAVVAPPPRRRDLRRARAAARAGDRDRGEVVVARPRPVVPDVLGTASDSSFPSGHAAGTAALCVALLALAVPRLGRAARFACVAAAVLVCAAVAASRVVLGVHYPSDVVAGLLLGTLCAIVGMPILSGQATGCAALTNSSV
jgi:membrane-associated phospholipid phosphatase